MARDRELFGRTEGLRQDLGDNRPLTPDEVCEKYQDTEARVVLRQLDEETILIEGDKVGLGFLGELILAQAVFELDDGFQISPRGPGAKFFNTKASLGLYISRKERAG